MNISRFTAPILGAVAVLLTSMSAQALTVDVTYTGTYNEQGNAPGNDYDNIGGLNDVAVFDLIGTPGGFSNTFSGSVVTPSDSGDFFTIRVAEGYTLTGAQIVFGTNIDAFNPLFSFSDETKWSLAYSSGTDPLIIDSQVAPNTNNGVFSPFDSGVIALNLGEGLYNVLLGNGVFGSNNGAVDYTMTFNVTGNPISVVPLPAALPLYGAGIAIMGFMGWRKKRKNS